MACATLKRSFDPLTSPQHGSQSKRRRCGGYHGHSPVNPPTHHSPFSEATPRICQDELTNNVHDEWRRLQRRKRLASPDLSLVNHHDFASQHASDGVSSMSTDQAASPVLSTMLYQLPGASPSRRDQPLFTVKQVVTLCERLWKEREERLKEEYDRVLNARLAEQYDSFLKFTQDQIMQRYQQSACSYVS